jgi:hypothetical protein
MQKDHACNRQAVLIAELSALEDHICRDALLYLLTRPDLKRDALDDPAPSSLLAAQHWRQVLAKQDQNPFVASIGYMLSLLHARPVYQENTHEIKHQSLLHYQQSVADCQTDNLFLAFKPAVLYLLESFVLRFELESSDAL